MVFILSKSYPDTKTIITFSSFFFSTPGNLRSFHLSLDLPFIEQQVQKGLHNPIQSKTLSRPYLDPSDFLPHCELSTCSFLEELD